MYFVILNVSLSPVSSGANAVQQRQGGRDAVRIFR